MSTAAVTPPAAGSRVLAGGIDTHYHDEGSGPPVVLLHGSGPGVSAWSNWSETITGLRDRFRLLAPEMVGYGRTERPEDITYGVRTWVAHIIGFLDALELERVSLVGNSMGGLVSLHIAQQRPERVDRLVLLGTPDPGMTPSDGLVALRAYEPSLDAMRSLLENYFAFDPSIVTDGLVRSRFEASSAPGVHEVYKGMFHDSRHTGDTLDLTDADVRSITAPSLVVHGAFDKVIPVEVGNRLARLIPDCDSHVFGRCGHWPQIERRPDFNRIVGDFLAGS